jgi:S1-C subfamily serine protease
MLESPSMKRIILTLSLTASLVPSVDLERVNQSLGKLMNSESNLCTAFSINEKESRWLTASHCLSEGPSQINGEAITAILTNQGGEAGVAVVVTRGYRVRALKLGKEPRLGDDIYQVGFGGGAPFPLAFGGLHLSRAGEIEDLTLQFSSAQGLKGMSGGPIVDRKGRVIGVVSGGVRPTTSPLTVSFSSLYENLKTLFGAYGG